MANDIVGSFEYEPVILLDGDSAAPVAAEHQAGPDGKRAARDGEDQPRPGGHRRVRNEAPGERSRMQPVAEDQGKGGGDDANVQQTATGGLAARRSLGRQGGDQPEYPHCGPDPFDVPIIRRIRHIVYDIYRHAKGTGPSSLYI